MRVGKLHAQCQQKNQAKNDQRPITNTPRLPTNYSIYDISPHNEKKILSLVWLPFP